MTLVIPNDQARAEQRLPSFQCKLAPMGAGPQPISNRSEAPLLSPTTNTQEQQFRVHVQIARLCTVRTSKYSSTQNWHNSFVWGCWTHNPQCLLQTAVNRNTRCWIPHKLGYGCGDGDGDGEMMCMTQTKDRQAGLHTGGGGGEDGGENHLKLPIFYRN